MSDKCEKCERLLKACEAALPFARTQSCTYADAFDCPDPEHEHMIHCCDWGPLVEQLTEAIRQAGGSLEAWTEEVRGTYQLEAQLASLTAANAQLEAQLAEAREREAGLRKTMKETLVGLKNAPELNASNVSEDDALDLNEEVNIACCKLESALSAPQAEEAPQ